MRDASLGDRRELRDHAEVRLGLGDDLRPLDLDRDDAVPSWSVARWTWAVEAAANGSGSIVANSSSGGLAELVLDDGARLLPRERRGVALELGQLGDDVGRQHVAAARDHLADLDVRRAELLEQDPEPLAARAPSRSVLLAQDPRREPAPERRDRRPGERRVERHRVDRVVDLLEAQVLDDQVAARRGQRLEQPPHRAGALRRAIRGRLSPRTASTTVDQRACTARRPRAAHRTAGCAICATSGAISDAAHSTSALHDDHEQAHRRQEQPAR